MSRPILETIDSALSRVKLPLTTREAVNAWAESVILARGGSVESARRLAARLGEMAAGNRYFMLGDPSLVTVRVARVNVAERIGVTMTIRRPDAGVTERARFVVDSNVTRGTTIARMKTVGREASARRRSRMASA